MKAVLLAFAFLAMVPAGLFFFYAIWFALLCRRYAARRGVCKFCGCSDYDCRQCIERTGEPCCWIDKRHTICSACVDHMAEADLDDLSPDCSPLNSGPSRTGVSNRGWRGSNGWGKT
jgi:hypothetical protein